MKPAWQVALLFPEEGAWSQEDYLALDSNRFVEFSNGSIEVLPVPTTSHQMLVHYLCGLLSAYALRRGLGTALPGPLRVGYGATSSANPTWCFSWLNMRQKWEKSSGSALTW